MTEALRGVVAFLFTETETKRIEAMARPENIGSTIVLDKKRLPKRRRAARLRTRRRPIL